MIGVFQTAGRVEAATTYRTALLAPVDPILALEALIGAGIADQFWVYSRKGETWIGANSLGHITVTQTHVALEWMGLTECVENVRDPFRQVEQLLKRLPLIGWRAFGHIAFDISGFYLPYPLRAPTPLLRFSVPQTELCISAEGTRVRTTLDLDFVSSTWNVSRRPRNGPSPITPDFSDRTQYVASATQLIESIRAGRLAKAILARRMRIPGRLDLLSTYAAIASADPATRTFCFKQPELSGVGASPELLLHTTRKRTVMTGPLAGTRRRGMTQAEDDHLRQELYADAKEVKEHAISILLAQEELNRVCTSGTVHIANFMQVLRFRCVQHLSSRVAGYLAPGQTCWDALRVLFPGVTVSGISKHEALVQIASLEGRARGAYGGCVGWIDCEGASDLAIAIRCAFEDASGVHVSAGAGIVAESVPNLEYEESAHKMQSVLGQLVIEDGHAQ